MMANDKFVNRIVTHQKDGVTRSRLEKGLAPNQRFVNSVILASYLGVNPSTVDNWVEAKKIPYYKIGGRIRFDIYEIEDWIEKCKVKESVPDEKLN